MNAQIKRDVDLVIIGGGVAGCIAAIALAESYNVVLIDKLREPMDRIGECLAPAARRILKQLDLLDGLEKKMTSTGESSHLQNTGTQSFWGSDQVHIVDHLRNPDGFGWHLNRQAFEIYLRESAEKRGVMCYWSTKLHACEYKELSWNVTVKPVDEESNQETQVINAKFVIDASGRQSHFARKLGIQREPFDKLIACWATFPNTVLNKMSTISASEMGWWYSAPLPNKMRVLAFQTDSDLIERSAVKDLDSFLELAKVNPEMAKILSTNNGKIEYHGTVAANSTRLNQVAGDQWAALGDAALSFDPLSSQGMFNAMASALQLSELIEEFGILQVVNLANITMLQREYSIQVDRIWEHYEKHKSIFYCEEFRWKNSDFWKRRHERNLVDIVLD